MNAGQVMKRGVVAAASDLPLAEVGDLLATHRISAVPVIDDRWHLLGMVGAEDLIRPSLDQPRPDWRTILARRGRLDRRDDRRTAGDVMSRDIVTVEETTPLRTLIDLLGKRPIKRLPVVRDGCLVGMISRVDVLRALAQARVGRGGAERVA